MFEKDEAIGGLLRFGIPDFKLNKYIIDRRVNIMEAEGLIFRTNCEVGKDISALRTVGTIRCHYINCRGYATPRPSGRRFHLKGIHFAMEFLTQQNRSIARQHFEPETKIKATGKNVMVIGGGDTGSDCVGTSNRQGALSVTQIEIFPNLLTRKIPDTPWPFWPTILKTSTSHEEGCKRHWSLVTKRFIGENGSLKGVEVMEVSWKKDENGRMNMAEIKDTQRVIPCELAFCRWALLNLYTMDCWTILD